MADNLIFPIGFDLQKAVEKAGQDWDKTYSQITLTDARGESGANHAFVSPSDAPKFHVVKNAVSFFASPYRVVKQVMASSILRFGNSCDIIRLTLVAWLLALNLTIAISQFSLSQITPSNLKPISTLSSSVIVRFWDFIKSYTDCLSCPRSTAQALSDKAAFSDFPPQPINSSERRREKRICFITKSLERKITKNRHKKQHQTA